MKKCPFCAEQIQDEAVKCRYCLEWIVVPGTDGSPRIQPPDTPPAAMPKGDQSQETPADLANSVPAQTGNGATDALAREEEIELGKALEAGRAAQKALEAGIADPRALARAQEDVARAAEARKALIRANEAVVQRVVHHYLGQGLAPDELREAAEGGFERGIDHFDWRKGRFANYSWFWVRSAVQRALRAAERTDGPDLKAQSKAERMEKRRLEESKHQEELARLGAEIRVAAMGILTEHQLLILTKRRGLDGNAPVALRTLGDTLGLSHERVRQIEQVAVQTLCSSGKLSEATRAWLATS